MPSRRANQTNNRAKKQAQQKRSDRQLSANESLLLPHAQNDIIGVVLAVISVAMIVSLIVPSTAVVTHALGEALVLGFGAGAMLVPISLLLFALTFFLPSDGFLSTRVALGLACIVLAALSGLSIMVEGAQSSPLLVFVPAVMRLAGGYVGGAVAWVLLTLVGRVIGIVVLLGLAIAGIVICGFSISKVVSKIYNKAQDFAFERRQAREEALAAAEEAASQVPSRQARGAKLKALDSSEAKTSFIGERLTSVLQRGNRSTGDVELDEGLSRTPHPPLEFAEEQADQAEEAPTILIPSRKKKTKAAAQLEDTAEVQDEHHGRVPEFLEQKRKAKKAASTSRPGETSQDYELPPLSILQSNPNLATSATSTEELKATAEHLQTTLYEFGLSSRVKDFIAGPLVTTFRVEMGEGERVNKITNLEDDIALSLAAESVRIFAPIPGTSLVGIEIPNQTRQSVCLGDVLPFAESSEPLELAIGRDAGGHPVVADLAKMPHLLIAGATGAGKSVMINSIIMSMLMRSAPEQVRLIMIDPKRVELGGYNGLPHLYVPVVTEPRKASSALQWAVTEMDRRLKLLERMGAREIKGFNSQLEAGKYDHLEHPPSKMPYLVIIIDELSDLMMVAGKDVEASIVRIAQLGRAAGIHLIVATQRPSADVVTGLIKANIENRIAFSVASGTDSRVILDQTGGERLLGKGDMLFKRRGARTLRVLGCYVSDPEIEAAVEFIKTRSDAEYHDEIFSAVQPGSPGSAPEPDESDDPYVWEAAQIVVDSQLGSTSGLQRRLKVGYARAGRIMDNLERKGVVGPPDGSKPREVLMDAAMLEELRAAEEQYGEVE